MWNFTANTLLCLVIVVIMSYAIFCISHYPETASAYVDWVKNLFAEMMKLIRSV